MKHLNEVLNKDIDINDFLNKWFVVNLKIDQSAFSIQKENGEIKYFGREGRNEINLHRRQGADLYEDIIEYLETRNLDDIPDGVQVFLEFFDDRLPTTIKYPKKPKNNMIISYVKLDGKILPPDHHYTFEMVELLGISPPPILYSGSLTSYQKELLVDYTNGKIDNFNDFVYGIFPPNDNVEYLMTNELEGIVLYFDDTISVKLNNPHFTEQSKKKDEDPFFTTLMYIIYKDLEKYSDDVIRNIHYLPRPYRSDIIMLTRRYVFNSEIEELEQYKEQVTSNRFARLSFDLLPREVFELVEKKWYAEDIYRILHFMLYKPKLRTNPKTGLTRERKDMINRVIYKFNGL